MVVVVVMVVMMVVMLWLGDGSVGGGDGEVV